MSVWLALILAGCGKDDPGAPPGAEDPCHPLASSASCLLPFPSDHWRGADGVVAVPEAVLPTLEGSATAGVMPMDFLAREQAHGFSPLPTLAAGFDAPIDAAALPTLLDPLDRSVADDSRTLLIDAETGERVLHLAEVDAFADPGTSPILVIRPLDRLRDGARYVVAVRDLPAVGGGPLAAPVGFAALRDGDGDAAAQDRFDAEIFPVLADQGLDRASLQLAWDFTVRTREDAAGEMLQVRQLALDWLAQGDPAVTIDTVDLDVDPRVARKIQGTIRVPLVVTVDGVGAALNRDADGRVVQNGEATVPFLALVPPSALDGGARLLQFGHGFFGTRFEIDDGFGRTLADATNSVVVCVDWQGMSRADLVDVTGAMLNDAPNVFRFTDRVHQAMVNQLVLARALKTTLAEQPDLRTTAGDAPVYDPSHLYFYGLSQGHILGSVYTSLSPDVERAVLGSGGAGFSLIMFRGLPFEDFAAILWPGLESTVAMQEFQVLSQTSFDPIDPAVYAPWLLDEPLPGNPTDRRVLMHLGQADTQVPSVAGRTHARLLGLPLLEPIVEPIDGLSTVAAPHDGSAVVEFSFGYPQPWPGTTADLSWEESEVHGALRSLPASLAQVDAFLRPDGRIEATCDGPCDPE